MNPSPATPLICFRRSSARPAVEPVLAGSPKVTGRRSGFQRIRFSAFQLFRSAHLCDCAAPEDGFPGAFHLPPMRYPTSSPRFSPRVLPARRADSDHTQSIRNAFTLIELLTVIAIIGILAGITFGITKGVNERAAINQARAELAALATALESYKRQYGDYPWTPGSVTTDTNTGSSVKNETDGPGILFNALTGKRGPKPSSGRTAVEINGRAYVDLSKFTLADEDALPDPDNTNQVANAFLDPWGRRYLYFYKVATSWKPAGYILLSSGPNGAINSSLVSSDGDLSELADDADNIYANR
ncbi:prepilin-type N-terminal cleavage/methylation domain-containing protein [Opitutaceae bacterium TAV1]|nr:prepilin-type N-terminal cleavage/methylation domain-containing protein [Opitutaceae bacterium TAV1]